MQYGSPRDRQNLNPSEATKSEESTRAQYRLIINRLPPLCSQYVIKISQDFPCQICIEIAPYSVTWLFLKPYDPHNAVHGKETS
jgi:hypothetical protein